MRATHPEKVSEAARIADQLCRAFDGSAWHGPALLELLEDVDAATAASKPLADVHSIWELVQHIAVWEDVGRRRLSGDRAQIEISSPEDWPPADRNIGDTARTAPTRAGCS